MLQQNLITIYQKLGILQLKSKSDTSLVMKVMFQNTPCKVKHMTKQGYEGSLVEISTEDLPIA